MLNRMFYNNILVVLQRWNLEQLKHQQCKLRILSFKVEKNWDLYQVPLINWSSHVSDTKPLKHSLHQSFTDKNKFVKRGVAVEFKAL